MYFNSEEWVKDKEKIKDMKKGDKVKYIIKKNIHLS